MDPKLIINCVSNCFIALSVSGFIALLRHPKSPIEHMPFVIKTWIRCSLGFIAAGSLYSAMALSNPRWSEIITNIGVANMFSWAFFWHKRSWRI